MVDRLGKNTAIYTVGNIGTKLISLLMIPFYSICLTPNEYGMVDVVSSIVLLCVPIVTLQLDQAVFRFVFQRIENEQKVLINSIISMNIFILFVCAFVYFFRNNLSIDNVILRIIVTWVVVEANYTILKEYNRGEGNIKQYVYVNLFNAIGILFLNVIFVYFCGLKNIGVFYSFIISDLLCFIYLAGTVCLKGKYCVDLLLIKRMLRFSVPLIFNTISFWIINLSDRMFIVLYLSDYYNGLYAMICKFPAMITSLYTGFVLAWQQEAIDLINYKDSEKIKAVEEKIVDVLFVFSIVTVVVLPIVYDYIIDERYHDSLYLAPILILGNVFLSMSQFFNGLLMASLKTINIGVTTAISAIINIVINYCFLAQYGIIIAAISTLIAFLFLFLSRTFYVKEFLYKKIIIKIASYTLLSLIIGIVVMRGCV